MEQGDLRADDYCAGTLKLWSDETREIVENLLTRLKSKEGQLNDREKQLDDRESGLKTLRNEVLLLLKFCYGLRF